MGATVISAADKGDGNWFRFQGVHLPCWIQNQLGDAFCGESDGIDFSHTAVPAEEIVRLELEEPIATLNLSYAEVSNHELVRLARVIDAKQVLLNALSIDADTLSAFSQMRSLARISAVATKLSSSDATNFVVGHPSVILAYGDVASGDGFVRLPVAQQ